MDLALESREENGWGVLEVQGEIDLHTSPQLRQAIVGFLERGQNQIVIDLSRVGFMDSSGLGVLVAGLKRAKERGGKLAVVSTQGSVQKVLSITGLDRVFQTFGSVEEATRS
jgi:anti-sigma B factor antagonist